MKEMTIIRNNLINEKGYSPYCGSIDPVCSMPRTYFNGNQFICPNCGWVSKFPDDFIKRYKEKWNIK
jgi:hypothetical protein